MLGEVSGLSKETKRLVDADNTMVIAREKGVGEVEEGKGGGKC